MTVDEVSILGGSGNAFDCWCSTIRRSFRFVLRERDEKIGR